jgi:hypothetical protein
MNTPLQVKQQLVILEVECNFLQNLVKNFNKDAHSMASNHRLLGRKERMDEDTMIHLIEDMEIEN